ncbi:2-oxoglutarate and iron-dependent oxygenase domain-containing protein 2 [Mytilus edulis]|uniref:2-oxoglutarate and iron-dependent oxygenase domain-containing protein 2 n=1 Tax=Mytilus edulis TaxID=6550 RepID=A0A8S3UKX8_MYTED|nr:2-oxoglutarate and iron-dependent oxygenase domain-containing protein 2 [Mytilus edulis]
MERCLCQIIDTLRNKGCATEDQIKEVLNEIKKELHRRETLGQAYLERRKIIQEKYIPKHPQIFRLKEEYLSPDFISLVNFCQDSNITCSDVIEKIKNGPAEKCYTLPVFTEEYCKLMMEELEHFENSDCPKARPNTMNNYGVTNFIKIKYRSIQVILNFQHINLVSRNCPRRILIPLREKYLHSITAHLYPECGGDDLDSHKAFVVKYKMGEDLDLNFHYDNAEVTINVALGKDFTGGDLYFGDMRTKHNAQTQYKEYQHVKYTGLLHRGQHMHGAKPIHSGERYNLIIWMRSSKIRNKLCPMCDNEPELIETVGFL